MKLPLVSIIIPTFNRDLFLEDAIRSVLEQDYHEREIIVVDDASSEATKNLCCRYPVLYLRQINSGPSAARNLGARHAQGELLAFLDDDDLWPRESLSWRVNRWINEPSFDHVIGRVRRFRQEEADSTIHFLDSDKEARHLLLLGSSLMVKAAFEKVGGFNEAIRMHDDTDLMIRMRAAGIKITYIPEICLYYRRHDGNVTGRPEYVRSQLAVLRAHLKRHGSRC